MIDDVTGIILTGGCSSRFGSNKALAPWAGKTIIEKVLHELRSIFVQNLIVAKRTIEYDFLARPNVHIVGDLLEDTHSLGGIYTGLCYSQTPYSFVTACDMPLLKPNLIAAICEAKHGYMAVVPVWRAQIQPLAALYSRDCVNVMKLMIDENRLRIKELFNIAPTRFFLEKEIEVFDPNGLSFVDLDTKEDYEKAKWKTAFYAH